VIVLELAIDHVGQATFQAAHRFVVTLLGLPFLRW
jgi:hypothetical protein